MTIDAYWNVDTYTTYSQSVNSLRNLDSNSVSKNSFIFLGLQQKSRTFLYLFVTLPEGKSYLSWPPKWVPFSTYKWGYPPLYMALYVANWSYNPYEWSYTLQNIYMRLNISDTCWLYGSQ